MSATRTEIIDALPFEDYADVPAVSKSFLDEFARCPAAGLDYYLYRGQDAPTKAMVMGSAVDCLLCEPSQFESRFYVRPETYDSNGDMKPWNGNSLVCKTWMREHIDRPVLTLSELDEAHRTKTAVLADPKAARLLQGCTTQQSVFWVDPRTGLQLKGRPDFVGPNYAIDLKTCRDASDRAISRAIAEYRYYVQAAMYMDGLKANGRTCDEFYFIFIETGDRPKPNVRRLKLEAVELGRMVYNDQLLKVRDCMRDNKWPGFSGDGEDVLEIDVPEWVHANSGGVALTFGGQNIEDF